MINIDSAIELLRDGTASFKENEENFLTEGELIILLERLKSFEEKEHSIIIRMNDDGVWEMRTEPYGTIECETEKDWEIATKLIEYYLANKDKFDF